MVAVRARTESKMLVGKVDRVTAGHQDGHGFAETPSHAQQHRGHETVLGGRESPP